MANPGIGNKFVSVNLNKSYGQPLPHPPPPTSSYYAGRSRVGGGLVVLSKPKNAQKAVPKLSVPRPLNLPSLRKEHERFDFSGNTHLGGGSSSGLRATSAAIGWTKPSTIGEKEPSGSTSSVRPPDFDGPIHTTDKSGAYKPPSFHHTVASNTSHGSHTTPSGRNSVFRGEDFPSLGAKMASESTLQKKKADPHQKPKQAPSLELTEERKSFVGVYSGDLNSGPSGNKENSGGASPLKTSNIISKTQKDNEYVKGVLPIVHLDQRSDWADDERDTGHGARDRSRVQAPQKGEHYWETAGIYKDSGSNSRGRHDDENLKHFPSEMSKYDLNGQETRQMSREGNDGSSWRGSHFHKELYGSRDTIMKDGQFAAAFVETGNVNSRKWNTPYERKDTGYVQGGRQWRHTTGLHGSWSTDKTLRYDIDQSSRHRGDIARPKSPFSPTIRGGTFSDDSVLSFGKSKHSFQKRNKPHLVDNGGVFDDHDIFSNGIGVAELVKKKKEAPRTDYYDPVRELFEAELEHVQIMQEQERQKIIEEQEMAVERARMEEENRIRLAKEHEENQRRLEEKAQEIALRAEQDRLEALRMAEEQKLAREEEKQKIFMEEERRKQAAKQKLLELEARIAKRQSDEAKLNSTQQNFLYVSKMGGITSEKSSDWEDGERMVERVTTSASSDTSNMSMFVDTGSRPTPYVVPPPSFTDRGKSVNIWRSDTVISGSKGHSMQDNIFSRKEQYNGRAVAARTYREDGFSYNVEGFSQEKQRQRWNSSVGDADNFIKDMENDSEFHRDSSDKFQESVWGRQNRGLGDSQSSHSSHSGRVYAKSDADVLHSIGRSRYFVRQPRVFPPPSSLPIHKSSQVVEDNFTGPSASLGSKVRGRNSNENSNYKFNPQEGIEEDDVVVGHHRKSDIDDYTINNVFGRCDSQSSLSVSSAPNSPMHLSHDDMEDSASIMLTVAAEEKDVMLEKNTSMDDEIGKKLTVGFSDEWDEKNERLQEQEEYEDDESCYEEEDEVHEVEGAGNDNLNLLEKNRKEDMGNELDFIKSSEVGTCEEHEPCIVNNEENTFRFAPVSSDMTGIPESHIGVMDLVPMNDSHQCVPQSTEKASGGDLGPGRTDEYQPLPPLSQDSLHFLDPPGTISVSQPMISISINSVQAELPVSHPFGLFSGPSMMKSEVPAIQIGSITMPLHLHHQEGQSLAHVQSQPPQFQFGQLKCTVPVTQPVSHAKPMVAGNHSVTQNVGALPLRPTTLSTDFGKFPSSHSMNSSKSVIPGYVDQTRHHGSFNTMETENDKVPPLQDHFTCSSMAGKNVRSESHALVGVGDGGVSRSVTKTLSNHPSAWTSSCGPDVKRENPRTIDRERRFFYNRNAKTWPPMLPQRAYRYDSGGYQRRPRHTFSRTEFRVRESIDRGHMMNVNVDDEKSHLSGRVIRVSTGNGQRKGPGLNKLTRSTGRSEWLGSGLRSSPYYDIVGSYDKKSTKESTRKKNFHDTVSGTAEDGSAPLQNGVVCVSEQPGLVHSDGDDFIEVRSKKQVLNDRRKQKAKEIKAKSRVTKVPLKSQRISPNGVFSVNASKIPPAEAEIKKTNAFSGLVVNEDHALISGEECSGFNTFPVSQALSPICTPPLNTEINDVISLEARRSSPQVNSFGGNAPEILPLTQSQFDEAMKPAHYETRAVSLGVHTSSVSELNMLPSSSAVMKENPFCSTSTSLDPILAGEKIQFGAVTPQKIIPSNGLAIAHAIGSSRLEIPLHTRGSPCQTECPILQNSFVCLDECVVDAEAAASAVAAAAISCDEIVLRDLGSHTTSLSDGRSFGVVGISGISSAEDIGEQQLSEKFMPEASMSVSLPADLSVETSPISLWPPPLASPHGSSGQVLSHFPGATPSHFQIFDMNQMSGTPVFSFGPHDDLSRCPSEPQNCISSSGPLGQWQQQHHSGVDSVYGSSTKFAGSFINPHSGIPNGHGPPHMVVYNHFSPVGQFGQMGLSFVGTTYLPSGKQPDWQHNPTPSALGSSGSNENGGLGSVNVFPTQHNSSNAPPMLHVAPGSPLMPMDSSLPMFDVPPFQGAMEMGGWPQHHQVHTSPSHPQPVSVPTHLHHHHHHHPPTSLPSSPFTARPSTPSIPETRPPFPITGPAPGPDPAVNPFQEKLVLVQPSLPPKDFSGRSQSVRATTGGDGKRQNAPLKAQQQQQQYGYGYPRGHRESGEWLHQGRMSTSGFQGRHTAKVVRQIYVAKQSGVPSKHV